jgi:hypothetical protein
MSPTKLVPAVALLALSVFGCGRSDGPDRAMEQQMKEFNLSRVSVGKFAGTVTVDGRPPREAFPKQALLVILYDPKNPTAKSPLHAPCAPDGHFEFHTYSRDDGIPTGSYVVLFAALKRPVLLGKGAKAFQGLDGLLNRYNDPDKNAQEDRFKVEVAEPGKSDWAFDLELAGKEPVASPGPKAITRLQ